MEMRHDMDTQDMMGRLSWGQGSEYNPLEFGSFWGGIHNCIISWFMCSECLYMCIIYLYVWWFWRNDIILVEYDLSFILGLIIWKLRMVSRPCSIEEVDVYGPFYSHTRLQFILKQSAQKHYVTNISNACMEGKSKIVWWSYLDLVCT